MKRLMALRKNEHIRDMCATSEFNSRQLIQPLFAVEGLRNEESILGLRDTKRQNIEQLLKQVELDVEAGVRHFILFPVTAQKSHRDIDKKFSAQVIAEIKKRFHNSLFLWIDTCLCSYTTHGHCGIIGEDQENFDVQQTRNELAELALSFAQAGADGVSPSDMMDGTVAAIRGRLDEGGFSMVPVMSYSTKFASSFYGPFRLAAHSAPRFGNRSGYQIDVRNAADALQSSVRAADEGAHLLMVKPGLSSIDLIKPIAEKTNLQVGAYQVSGEFAALAALEEKGLISFNEALLETWHVFKRAGAQFIITYGARYAKQLGLNR